LEIRGGGPAKKLPNRKKRYQEERLQPLKNLITRKLQSKKTGARRESDEYGLAVPKKKLNMFGDVGRGGRRKRTTKGQGKKEFGERPSGKRDN